MPSRDRSYYLVAYYGSGFPPVVRDKEFIVRTQCSDPVEFTERTLAQYPAAQQLRTAAVDTAKLTGNMYILCLKVTPVPGARPARFTNRDVPDTLLAYYKQNEVSKFVDGGRAMHRGPKAPNETEHLWVERRYFEIDGTLPGLLNRSPVCNKTLVELCPIENAIETVEKKNELLCMDIKALNINSLTMQLKGVVDAAVNGGTELYRSAFLTDAYLPAHPQHGDLQCRLAQLLVDQITIVEEGLRVHGASVSVDLRPLHQSLEDMFENTKRKYASVPGNRVPYGDLPYLRPKSSIVALGTPVPQTPVAQPPSISRAAKSAVELPSSVSTSSVSLM